MLTLGLMLSSDTESLFVRHEIESVTEERVRFVTLGSLLECGSFIDSCKIDGYITTLSGHEQTLEEDESIDWFAFSWYEDYQYNVLYFTEASQSLTVIVPPFAKYTETLKRKGEILIFRGQLPKAIDALIKSEVQGVLVPGRCALYLEREFPQLKNIRKTILPMCQKAVSPGEFVVVFKKGNPEAKKLAAHFIKSVRFVGGGAGNYTMCTQAGINELKYAQVCLHDTLIDHRLLNFLPSNALIINAGKRHYKHSLEQPEINKLLVRYARMGLRVVRLKSGDASIFGRLAEEISYMEKHGIPYRVIPGTSSLNALSRTGIVLTRRTINRGFCVMSPIKHGGSFASVGIDERRKLPIVFFMGIRVVDKIAKELMEEGLPPDTKAAVAFSVAGSDETLIRGTLSTISEKISARFKGDHLPPGLFIVGEIAGFRFKNPSLLNGTKIIVAGEETEAGLLSARLEDFGADVEIFTPFSIASYEIEKAVELSYQHDAVVFSEKRLMEEFSKVARRYMVEPELIFKDDIAKEDRRYSSVLYIYIRRDHNLLRSLNLMADTVEELKCTPDMPHGSYHSAQYAIFLDNETLLNFLESGYAEALKEAEVWIPDSSSSEILKRKGIQKISLLEKMPALHSDVRFILSKTRTNQTREVAI